MALRARNTCAELLLRTLRKKLAGFAVILTGCSGRVPVVGTGTRRGTRLQISPGQVSTTMSENNAAAKLTDDSDELIELAKLAEQAERYDDMKAVRIVLVYVHVCMWLCTCFSSTRLCVYILNMYQHKHMFMLFACVVKTLLQYFSDHEKSS